MLTDQFMRRWCADLSRTLPVERIDRDEAPYLHRYFAAGWSPRTRGINPGIFLHHFRASDPQTQVHSHPWEYSVSLILAGGYREERCIDGRTEVREYRPGDVNVIQAADRHRIELVGEDCWTLFLKGNYAQPWGFTERCE